MEAEVTLTLAASAPGATPPAPLAGRRADAVPDGGPRVAAPALPAQPGRAPAGHGGRRRRSGLAAPLP